MRFIFVVSIILILGLKFLDEPKIYRHDLPLNISNTCSKDITCNLPKEHIVCNVFITNAAFLGI